jgi:hypothetical protein
LPAVIGLADLFPEHAFVTFLWMKYCLLLLCLTLLLTANSSAAKKNQDYAAYFSAILAAEHRLANDDLAASLDAYVTLFRQYDFVFARDVYNALQLAILAGRPAERDVLLTHCARSGVPAQMLRRNSLVHSAYASDSVLFRELFAKGYRLYLLCIDTVLLA